MCLPISSILSKSHINHNATGSDSSLHQHSHHSQHHHLHHHHRYVNGPRNFATSSATRLSRVSSCARAAAARLLLLQELEDTGSSHIFNYDIHHNCMLLHLCLNLWILLRTSSTSMTRHVGFTSLTASIARLRLANIKRLFCQVHVPQIHSSSSHGCPSCTQQTENSE